MTDTNRHRSSLIRLFGLGVLLFPLVAILFENGRSRRTWEEYKKEWEAKGERFDRAAFVSPAVPDEQNFAATPLLAPLLGWHFDTTNWCMAYEDPDAARRAQGLFVWLEDVVERRTKFQGAEFARIGVVEDRFRRFPDAAPMEVRMMLENSRTNTAAGLLKVFELHDTAMAELELASRRPSMVVWRGLNPALFPESPSLWGTVRRVGAAFRARALARLRTGDVDGALADIRTGLNVSGLFRSEPSMWSGLVRNALLRLSIEPVWEGLARHQWEEGQIKEIESWLGVIDLMTEGARCLRAERADWLDLLDALIRSPEDCFSMQFGEDHDFSSWRWTPDALFRHNQLALARLYQKTFLPPLDTTQGFLDVAAVGEWIRQEDERETGLSDALLLHVFTWGGSASGRAVLSFAETQAWVAMARLACVLERYRLAAGDYPGELAALVPEFIDAIPPDPAGGGDLHYQRTDDGRFVLYSVGRNGRDDGGRLVFYKDRLVNTWAEDCDWVWTYPVD